MTEHNGVASALDSGPVRPQKTPSPRVIRKRQHRMKEILEVTSGVLTERGYAGTSLDEIAERLDLTKASLYHYYESREELLTECLQYIADSVNEIFVAQIERDRALPIAERLRLLIQTQVRTLLEGYRPLTELFIRPVDMPEPYRSRIKAMRDRHNELFRVLIDEGISSGAFHCVDPVYAAHCIHGAINYSPIWYTSRSHGTSDEFAAKLSLCIMPLLASP